MDARPWSVSSVQIIQEVLGRWREVVPFWRRDGGALGHENAGNAVWTGVFECGATSTVKPAGREKYTTECIEGLSAGGVKNRTEPHGFDFSHGFERGRRNATVGTGIFHHRADRGGAGIRWHRGGSRGHRENLVFHFFGALPGRSSEWIDAESIKTL